MTQFLISDDKPDGYKLEGILHAIRKDIILRATRIFDDNRPEARKVLDNNVKILQLLSESINIAEESTSLLDRTFGPHEDGKPRIGTV
jgi:hypothetical protein